MTQSLCIDGPAIGAVRWVEKGKEGDMDNPAEKVQSDPKPTTGRPIWELVVDDMTARDKVGRAKYGVPLQAGNGRDALVDAYQESLDQCVYLRQAIEEREMLRVAVRDLLASHWNSKIQSIADMTGS